MDHTDSRSERFSLRLHFKFSDSAPTSWLSFSLTLSLLSPVHPWENTFARGADLSRTYSERWNDESPTSANIQTRTADDTTIHSIRQRRASGRWSGDRMSRLTTISALAQGGPWRPLLNACDPGRLLWPGHLWHGVCDQWQNGRSLGSNPDGGCWDFFNDFF